MKTWSIKCPVCKRQTFTFSKDLNAHLKEKHPGFRYPCQYCSKTFQTANACYKHEVAHGGKTHACNNCDKSFQFPKELELHMRVHTGLGVFTCKICGCIYTTNHTFNQHMKKHTDPPVKCSKCTLTFSTKADLDQHFRGG